jgi:hypothetical protein
MSRTKRFPVALPIPDRMEFLKKVIARKQAELELIYSQPTGLIYVPPGMDDEFQAIVDRVKPP